MNGPAHTFENGHLLELEMVLGYTGTHESKLDLWVGVLIKGAVDALAPTSWGL